MKILKVKFPLTKQLKNRIAENIKKNGENVAVAGLIKQNNYYLLVKNEKPPFNKDWIFPAGGVEDKEDPKTAIKREILEETNLNVTVGKIYCTLVLSELKKSKIIVYTCKIKSGNLRPGKNIKAVGMFKILPSNLHQICKKIL